ncbi:LysR family transcriptional regulator [Altererythrobacter sp. B11]|uniref:LysR family transcriptional regulator n=1 Tax=Altererythrobacter sp. B11 TaxID=2060312 RepID=UPI000DC73600|nr:LysR family transcriptional regulator [Altererythrobacter sp. B11]BBC71909.1 LysR family transcriptional regulator [Altererythrobacter sp. B11]
MPEPGTPTLDQLGIFLAVVEEGSFAAAGRRLNRAVSVISYGIANLEAQLGLKLFEREGTRRPVLTAAGEAVLADARIVAGGIAALRAKARGLLQGLEAEVGLAVDVMLPAERIAVLLRGFRAEFPTVSLRLHVEALGAVAARVLDGSAGLGIAGPVASAAGGLVRAAAGCVPLVPVAAPDHPLARMARLEPGAARAHIQLVLTDRSPLTEGRDFAVTSPQTWRLADLGAKHALLREGIGWGNMPLPMIEGDLMAGTLVRLVMPDHPGGLYRFYAVHREDTPPGPATAWLMQRFEDLGRGDPTEGLPEV